MASTGFLEVQGASAALEETLRRVRDHGASVTADDSKSIGSGQSSRELINFQVDLENPIDRLIANPLRRTNIVTSIARFVWMMAGNNRLADIAFYEPKVSKFTDDGLTVPGSNYGMRMIQPRPGIDQITGVVRELKNNRSTRRATIAIYHPEDAIRQDSSDIPCTFGLNYLVRDGKLHATTIMRSNNAVALLPFNLFEFSLLAEVIAVEAGVTLGTLSHIALSMHIYDRDMRSVDGIIDAAGKISAPMMASMPKKPLEKIKYLAILEAELRHEAGRINEATVEDWIKKADDPKLGPYWGQFYLVLLSHVADRIGAVVGRSVRSAIREPFTQLLSERPTIAEQRSPTPDLFSQGPAVINILDSSRMKSLRRRLEEHEISTKKPLGAAKTLDIQEYFAHRVAARSNSSEITSTEFKEALSRLIPPK